LAVNTGPRVWKASTSESLPAARGAASSLPATSSPAPPSANVHAGFLAPVTNATTAA